ncbi:uncharacterized protein [Penaeus vannamei]|uniref:uncharacterized protein n=1 Tax=Penaeus vannamei TaxID=6689 RepID=UPI00387FA763
MLWLGTILLFVNTVESQGGPRCVSLGGSHGSCGSQDECSSYLSLVRQKDEASVKPLFRTTLGNELLNYVSRCCESASSKPLIPSEEECGFSEPSGPANDLQRVIHQYDRGCDDKSKHLPTLRTKYLSSHTIRYGQEEKERERKTNFFCHPGVLGIWAKIWSWPGMFIGPRKEEISITWVFSCSSLPLADYALLLPWHDINYIRPVCLPFNYRTKDFVNERLAVVGYGSTSFGGQQSKLPIAAVLNVLSLRTCHNSYKETVLGRQVILTDSQMCAGGASGSSCTGDSGGPLNFFDINTRRFYIVGLVSFGYGCGEFPEVYTRVGAYLHWIENTLNDSTL